LIAAALSVSPYVEDTSPGVCTLGVGALAVERHEPALSSALVQLAQLGMRATAGLAPTPLLALYAARHGAERGRHDVNNTMSPQGFRERRPIKPAKHGAEESAEPTASAALAKNVPSASSRRSAPPSPGIFRVDDRTGFLRDLPLAVADPPSHLAEILAGWGIHTLGGLTALSKADVTQRLGADGLQLWECAAGEVTRPLRMIALPQTFTAQRRLEHEIETLEPLLFVLRRFVDRLALELRNAGFVAGEMTLGLRLTDDTTYTRSFRLPEPTAREEILFRVLQTHLENLHTAATVRGVDLQCTPVRPLARQQGLFESGLRDPHGFAETLARVAAVVGAERVGTPEVENSHCPDAVRLVPPAKVVPPLEREGPHAARGLPLRRYRPPLKATVELSGPTPVFVWTSALQGAVRGSTGPWRGSGAWWDAARAWNREEWDAELENGGVYRLLHTREGWFVEGQYD
jgi:protein ImuB